MTVQAKLRSLIDAADAAYGAFLSDPRGKASTRRIFEMLRDPLDVRESTPERLPACAHLGEVAIPERYPNGPLRQVIEAFLDLEPHLNWRLRTGDTTNANATYWDNHAFTMIVGPGGLAPHDEVLLGVSLQGPGVRYPDHTHPPEETYLVLSDGEFSQDGTTWFTPGVGGTFYNPPGILHAMRSGETPLLAMWALRAER